MENEFSENEFFGLAVVGLADVILLVQEATDRAGATVERIMNEAHGVEHMLVAERRKGARELLDRGFRVNRQGMWAFLSSRLVRLAHRMQMHLYRFKK